MHGRAPAASPESPATPAWRRRGLLLLLFLLPLCLRLAFLLQVRDQPLFSMLVEDELLHDTRARQIAAGDWVGTEIYYQSPLYPYFVAVIYAVLGVKPMAVRLVQIVLGSLSCVMLFLIGKRLRSAPAGIAAAVIGALYGPLLFHDCLILKASLAVFFSCLLLLQLSFRIGSRAILPWLPAGATLALLVLLRGNAYLYLPFIVAWIALVERGRRLAKAACFVAGLFAILLPVAMRNTAVGGDLVFSESQAGTNFYIGNNPRATGSYVPLRVGRQSPADEKADAYLLAAGEAGRALKPSEVSRFWFGKAASWIRSEPAAFARLTLKKLYLYFADYELPDAQDFYHYRERSPILRLAFFSFSPVVLLALCGYGLGFRGRLSPASSLLLTLVVAAAASVVPFYIFARYRLPAVPPLIVLGGVGICSLWDEVRARNVRRLVVFVAAAAAFLTLSSFRPVRISGALVPYNAAVAHSGQGRTAEALQAVSEAIDDDPTLTEAYLLRGSLHERAGRTEEALADYGTYIARVPGQAQGYARRGNLLDESGRSDEALGDYARAILLEPGNSGFRVERGAIRGARGDYLLALEDLLAAVRLDPKNVTALQNIHVAYRLRRATGAPSPAWDATVERLAPGFEGHLVKGYLAFAEKDLPRALEALSRAVEANPRSAVALNYRGLVCAELGRADQAAADFDQAAKADPAYADTYNHRGLLQLKAARHQLALQDFDRALLLRPDDALFYLNRAAALEGRGRWEAALEDCIKAAALDPANAEAASGKARLEAKIAQRRAGGKH